MVMTLKDHADVETEGTLSPYQARRAELQYRVTAAAARRDREERRTLRLLRLIEASNARHAAACNDVVQALTELRGMRA